MTNTADKAEAAARAICQERCAFMGEPACWQVSGGAGSELPWPNPDCDEPGCHALAAAAVKAMEAADG